MMHLEIFYKGIILEKGEYLFPLKACLVGFIWIFVQLGKTLISTPNLENVRISCDLHLLLGSNF